MHVYRDEEHEKAVPRYMHGRKQRHYRDELSGMVHSEIAGRNGKQQNAADHGPARKTGAPGHRRQRKHEHGSEKLAHKSEFFENQQRGIQPASSGVFAAVPEQPLGKLLFP